MDADAEVQEIMRQYGYLGPSVAAAIAAALRRAHEAGRAETFEWCAKVADGVAKSFRQVAKGEPKQ